MPASRYVASSNEWIALHDRAQALVATLPSSSAESAESPDQLIDTLAVAEAFKAIAVQLLQATTSSDQSSQRFRAVVKALDFTTTKSALQAFLQG